jgi:hypothetical protein
MFPIAADRLSISDIAALWSEEIRPPRTPKEMQYFLEKAFWRGEFRGDGPSRLDVLRVLRWGPVPDRDPATWTEEECAPAFESVANFWPYERIPGLALTSPFALLAVGLTRTEFMAWIIAKGYHRPSFWGPFPPIAEAVSQASTATAELAGNEPRRRGPKPKKREGVIAQMRAEIDSGAMARQQLAHMLEKELAHRYCVSRDTARRARKEILGLAPCTAISGSGRIC